MPRPTSGPTILFGRHYVWFQDRGTAGRAPRWCLLRDTEADARADRVAGARHRVLDALGVPR